MNRLTALPQLKNFQRFYTCIVERYVEPKLVKKGIDPRKVRLKAEHYHYKFVDCEHTKKWGNTDVILTEYLEGIGYKGQMVNISRHMVHYELLPAGLCVFPTDENLQFYKQDMLEAAKKPVLSKDALGVRDYISHMTLEIQLNVNEVWTLNENFVRIALRYNGIMCSENSIQLPENYEDIKCDGKTYFKDTFTCNIKINSYMDAQLRCKIVPVDNTKIWSEFAMLNRK